MHHHGPWQTYVIRYVTVSAVIVTLNYQLMVSLNLVVTCIITFSCPSILRRLTFIELDEISDLMASVTECALRLTKDGDKVCLIFNQIIITDVRNSMVDDHDIPGVFCWDTHDGSLAK